MNEVDVKLKVYCLQTTCIFINIYGMHVKQNVAKLYSRPHTTVAIPMHSLRDKEDSNGIKYIYMYVCLWAENMGGGGGGGDHTK